MFFDEPEFQLNNNQLQTGSAMKEKVLCRILVLLIFLPALSGCANIAKGVAEAFVGEKGSEESDAGLCYVRGRPFPGLDRLLMDQENAMGQTDAQKAMLKVLMVHGIGSHKPGYATRLSENLAQALQLPMVQEHFKEFSLTHPKYPDIELGILRVNRFLSADKSREMLFYELTWDIIVEEEKQTIDFDNSGEYSFQRASFNETLKLFVNDTVPDLVMYYGKFREPVQFAVGQSFCWMGSGGWEDLPDEKAVFCDRNQEEYLDKLDGDLVFITHSLGSRVTFDALQTLTRIWGQVERDHERKEILQNQKFSVFMLSNQLPLLQLGRERPQVTGQISEICTPGAAREDDRLLKELRIVAFSDPNDLFSYPIPPRFLNDYVDSRLCPTLTNITLNVSPVKSIFGLGELANPLAAHVGYDNDERVIQLLTNGIGSDMTSPVVTEKCVFSEAIPD